MRNILVAVFLFVAQICADTTTISTETVPESFNISTELKKLENGCFNDRDHELLHGEKLKYAHVNYYSTRLMELTICRISLQELRASLNLTLLPPFSLPCVVKKKDIWNITTIQAYYDAKEPECPYDCWFFEHNIEDSTKFLDKHWPTIRQIFGATYKKKLTEIGKIDRKMVDAMLSEFEDVKGKMKYAVVRKLLESYSLVGWRPTICEKDVKY